MITSDSSPYVEVSADSMTALSEPHFLIKVGEAYYLTLAVWKYDPDAPEITAEQRSGVAHIRHLFEGAGVDQVLPAVQTQFEVVKSGGRTGPPPRHLVEAPAVPEIG